MNNDLPAVGQQSIRGTDSNSLLRLYDRAREVRDRSPSQAARARADSVILRIGQELKQRNIRV
jgi:hypothetical protein